MYRVDQENAERIDVLCNVAGGFMMGEGVAETSDETWDFLFNLNTKSVMHMAAAAVPLMRESGSGKIINVGALAAARGLAKWVLISRRSRLRSVSLKVLPPN